VRVSAVLLGPSGANLMVARGAIPTTTPNRLTQANNDTGIQRFKNEGNHGSFSIS
jgi:hypothetical protein